MEPFHFVPPAAVAEDHASGNAGGDECETADQFDMQEGVYIEKPLTLFVREGRWLIDVAARHKRVVQVGTQQRSGEHYAKARDLIRGGLHTGLEM